MKHSRTNIILIGMMGSWKTTVGRILAENLNRAFIDIDHALETESGFTVSEVFERFGEEKFRLMETEILQSVLKNNNCIISTGGGTIISEINRKMLIKNGITILLRAKPESLAGRIKNTAKRPILNGSVDKTIILSDIWNKRKKLYEETANYIIDTDDLIPEKIAESIERILGAD